MKCVHTFGTDRHKRQADITFWFEYITLLTNVSVEVKCVDPDLGLHCLTKRPLKFSADDKSRQLLMWLVL